MSIWSRSFGDFFRTNWWPDSDFHSSPFSPSGPEQGGNMNYGGYGGYGQNTGYGMGGYGQNQGYGSQNGAAPQDVDPTYAVRLSFTFADSIGRKRSLYPSEAEVSLSEKLRYDYLAFMGYLYDPQSAEPVRQVEYANQILELRQTTKRFFAFRQENSLKPDFLNEVPVSLKYFAKADLAGGKGTNTPPGVSRFLVNTFRDLGIEYIAYGGVSEQELKRLTDYLMMLNNFLRSCNLFFVPDPLRRGGKGDPSYGVPGMKSAMPDAGVDMSTAAGYYEDDSVVHTLFEGVKGPEVPERYRNGIDMPEKARPGRNMSGQAEKREEKKEERMEVRKDTRREKYADSYKKEEEDNRSLDDLLAELDRLIGLDSVKENLNNLINVIRIRKLREEMGLAQPDMSLHLVFSGNPGTGKTTVARLLAKIYKALGVVSEGQLVEVDRAGLVEGYVGQTAQKTQEVIDSALGGVLFIDEAYTLTNKKESGDYGQEAVDTLLKRMEDDRDSFVVIAAGYTDQMEEFLESNPGLRSRFSKTIEFEDYSAEELSTILIAMCAAHDFRLTEEAEAEVRRHFEDLVEEKEENFANAREARNYFERCIERQANRLVSDPDFDRNEVMTLTLSDVTETEEEE